MTKLVKALQLFVLKFLVIKDIFLTSQKRQLSVLFFFKDFKLEMVPIIDSFNSWMNI